ncbi:MAG: atsA 22 [Acidobacteria bacterium]|nr:atsA 22 [Acidobacteriota bacterium]
MKRGIVSALLFFDRMPTQEGLMKRGIVSALLLSLAGAHGLPASETTRPNILYIMSDDHAAHAISAYDSRINQTPNIDRLAKEGIR